MSPFVRFDGIGIPRLPRNPGFRSSSSPTVARSKVIVHVPQAFCLEYILSSEFAERRVLFREQEAIRICRVQLGVRMISSHALRMSHLFHITTSDDILTPGEDTRAGNTINFRPLERTSFLAVESG